MILNYINWTVSPEIISLGPASIRWYGLLFAAGFYIGFLILRKFYTYEKLSVEKLDNLAMYMLIGTLVGARFGHCLFYEPEYYLSSFSHFIEIIKPWSGEIGKDAKLGIRGLASHGGALGILIVLTIYCYSNKISYLWLLDRIVIPTSLTAGFIRLGNLMNHEIVGVETDLPWGFIFHRLRDNVIRHPAQLYEAICYFVIFAILIKIYYKRKAQFPNGYILGLFFILAFSARFLIEFVKENQVTFENNMTLNMGQWLSIPFLLIGFLLIVLSNKRKKTETTIK